MGLDIHRLIKSTSVGRFPYHEHSLLVVAIQQLRHSRALEWGAAVGAHGTLTRLDCRVLALVIRQDLARVDPRHSSYVAALLDRFAQACDQGAEVEGLLFS